MVNEFITARKPLGHYAQAIHSGKITVGFMGGSITDPGGRNRWSDKIIDWLVAQHPGLIVNVENAAKGATGALTALLRAEEDILPTDCDIVFIETAVNDGESEWGPCREGLLRKLLKQDRFDVVLVYTYAQWMYEDMLARRLPPSMADWEKLAEHYGLASVSCGAYAFEMTAKGALRWEEWLPDGLHPELAGSRVYAEAVAALLEKEENSALEGRTLPEPLYADHWENTYSLPWEQVERIGPWRLVRERRLPTATYILYTASVRAGLAFDFEGRGVVLRRRVNGRAADLRCRVDGGEWSTDHCVKLKPWGVNATDWIRDDIIVQDLPMGKHHIELETFFAEEALGSNIEICTIGIIR